ncbi:MAG: electron transport complex subunit RsxC [Bacillota bacterium]
MAAKTFRGGVHPPEHKEATSSSAIETIPPPQRVVVPLVQHIGAPCEPTIVDETTLSKGDRVDLGQQIGDSEAFVTAPVHASVSGEIAQITTARLSDGRNVKAIVIDSDGEDRISEGVTPASSLENLSPEEIKNVIREAGIVGMGGAAFPSHVKYSPPEGVVLDTIIINGCECEPFLTCDDRLMIEEAEEIVFGLEAIIKSTGAKRGVIGIENNKPQAIESMRSAVEGTDFEVEVVKTKYPEGAERQLIRVITGREVPSGKLPLDIGVVVNNVATAAAIARAIKTGMPSIERVVTVAGDVVERPANLRVRIGTPIRELFEYCGGFTEAPSVLIAGGPMMGHAIADLDMPVVKSTCGILALSSSVVSYEEEEPCIRCGRCLDVCPVYMMPLMAAQYPDEKALEYNPLDCIECGACSYICPANQRLLERIRMAKQQAQAIMCSDS